MTTLEKRTNEPIYEFQMKIYILGFSLLMKTRQRQLDPGGPGPGQEGHGGRDPGLSRQRPLGHQVQDPAQPGRLGLGGLHRRRGGRFRTGVLRRATL